MSWTDLLLAQLLDPFRIGLIGALLYTALRNRAATGLAVPLAAGVGFVAVILPSTFGPGAAQGLGLWLVAGVGVLTNLLLLAGALLVWQVFRHFGGGAD